MASVVFAGGHRPVSTAYGPLARARIELSEPTPIERARYDTFDGRLHQAGLRLECRLLSAGRGALLLTDAEGGSRELSLTTVTDLGRPLPLEELPAGRLRSRLAASTGGRALLPQVWARSLRRSGTADDDRGRPRIGVNLDTDLVIRTPGTVGVRGEHQLRWTVEVETVDGRPKPAAKLCRRLTAELTLEGRPPLTFEGDALELAAEVAGIDRRGWRGAVRPDLTRSDRALTGTRAVLTSFADAIDANWQGTVDHLDDDFLHDLRIGVRQTRSLLAQSRRILPDDVRDAQREAFRWLGDVTSTARDLDVYLAGWSELTGGLEPAEREALEPVRAHLMAQRDAVHGEVAQALGSDRARRLREEWRGWLALPDTSVSGGRDARRPLGKVIGRRFLDAQAEVLERGRAIDADSPAEELHELRKSGKQLRYLLEGFGHLGGKDRSTRMIRHLRRLQDNLGAHQDVEVQAARLRHALEEMQAADPGAVPAATVAAGEGLATTLDARQARERDRFAARFDAYDRRKVRRTLTDLVGRMEG